MFAVDGDIEAALGHPKQVLVQVPEAEPWPVDEAGWHVGGQCRQAGVEAVLIKGWAPAGAGQGSGWLCCQRIFRLP